MSVFNFRRVIVSLILIILLLFTFSYGVLTDVFSQEMNWEIHKYVYQNGEEVYPFNVKAFAIVVTNPQLVDKVEDIVPKRYLKGINPPPDEIEDYDENHYKLIRYIDRELAEYCCSFPLEQMPLDGIMKGYSKNAAGECILLIILYFYNPDKNDVEICNVATAEGDDIYNPGEKITKSSEDPCITILGYKGPPVVDSSCYPPGGGVGIIEDLCFEAKIGDCVVTNADGTPITFSAKFFEIFLTSNPYWDEDNCFDQYSGGSFITVHQPDCYHKIMLYTGLALSNPESEFYGWLLERDRNDPRSYIRDAEYHECDIVRPDIPAKDSSGEQLDSKGVLELLYEITAEIKGQIPGNGEFVRLNEVKCPEEEDESANDFSDVGGIDCNGDKVVDIPIDNPYDEEP